MFGYFEALLRLGDPMKILAEESRLKSLNNLLNSVGFQEEIYEDFVDETISLLRGTAASIPCHDDGAALLASFNDAGLSNAIITHFRLITSAWMKNHAESYQPFLPDKSVDEYCGTSIEPYQVEIEHLGMNALIEAVINPAGMAVEILYLDRSEGNEVNSHRFELLGPDGQALNPHAPTIRLLYRP
ncbi:MAG: hypothetical protein LQ347_005919 [Umbilicaria vellea]|nr:MAG: hypothetical protein LQ347_005919 [Umbilicaria vellea]